ncbi:MAG TPA: phosphomannomutase/phosphoglucomutase [Nitrospinota bacterium]|nr:phosphomannomutase/phosphoglucomutase [Nitrospinota bacterium]
MNPQIFREYDIRGIIDKELNRDVAYDIGRAYGTYITEQKKGPIAVGRDFRLNSEELKDGLIEGILSTGWDVIDVGLVPTPLLYYALFYFDASGGIMITGSHNPPEFNGFKVCVGKWTISGNEIQDIRKIIEKGEYSKGKGELSYSDIIPEYIDLIYTKINLQKKLNVVIDAGNGTAGIIAPKLLRKLGCYVTELFCEPNGNFPNHFADPTVPKNLKDMISKVKENKADLGIAYDGDGDRIGVVDENGEILFGDYLLMIFSRDILKRNPGAKVVFEVKCSQNLFDDIKKHGGIPIMGQAGHSLIKKRMKKEKAAVGGEMSGHMFFADDYFGYDDAIYASARLLQILSKTEKKLSELLDDVPKTFSTPEIRIDCPDNMKFQVVEKIKAYFKEHFEVIDIDGVRVTLPDGWGLLRASNTQPVLVLRFEANSKERLEEIRKIFKTKLKELGGLELEE